MSYPNKTEIISVTIPNGAAGLSAAVDLDGKLLLEIQMPAAWVAAALTFQTGDTAATCQNMYDDVGEYSLATPAVVAASRNIRIPPEKFLCVRFLKIRSGTAAVPVNQTADRVLKLLVVPA